MSVDLIRVLVVDAASPFAISAACRFMASIWPFQVIETEPGGVVFASTGGATVCVPLVNKP